MPAHLKALLVIMVLSTITFAVAKAPAAMLFAGEDEFKRRRNLWFALTLTVFLAHNFWLYIVVAGFLLYFAGRSEPNKLALYFFVLLAVPAISAPITGLGIIQHLFVIDYVRLLALTVLLPAYLEIRRRPDTVPFGRTLADKFLAGYLALLFLLTFQVSNLFFALRTGLFYAFIDVFLPYYVASRSLGNLERFRSAIASFAIAAMVLAPIVALELAKTWLLYSKLSDALGVGRWGGLYLSRGDGGALRAVGTVGHSIPLGYVMAVALGLFFFLRHSLRQSGWWYAGLLLLAIGLAAPLSRGPWVGAAAALIFFIVIGPAPVKGLFKLAGLVALIVPPLLVSPIGDKIIGLLPFVGTVDMENIIYRERLITASLQVIQRQPYFGSFDYLLSEEMQELVQGQGIIDVVNTYIGVVLGSGLVGLTLFCGAFLAAAFAVARAMRRVKDKSSELHLLGRVLLSTLVGVLVTIFTVSSINIIPTLYWLMAGLCMGYARLVATTVSVQQTDVPTVRGKVVCA